MMNKLELINALRDECQISKKEAAAKVKGMLCAI
jgi:nucleoid DNA-binding protein